MAKVVDMGLRALQSRGAIELLSDKWRIPVLHILSAAPLRSNQLQRAIPQVSPKVLTQTLRGMERDGLISRTIYPVVPPKVDYRLTNMGRSLIQPLRGLCHWAQAHIAERDRAREAFEQQQPLEAAVASHRKRGS